MEKNAPFSFVFILVLASRTPESAFGMTTYCPTPTNLIAPSVQFALCTEAVARTYRNSRSFTRRDEAQLLHLDDRSESSC